MAPGARTQTTVLEKLETSYLEYQLDHRPKPTLKRDNNKDHIYNANGSNNNIYTQKQDAYDQVLPKNEWKFMSHVRRWEKSLGFVTPIRWIDATAIILFHIVVTVGTIYAVLSFKFLPRWQTVVYSFLMGQIAGFGVTGGAHRLWSHRSYKAKWPLQIILLLCYSVAGQNDLFQWVRDHRVHHKFSESSADPHNANRGFFFAHVGWLMMKKHPDVLREGVKVDMRDIYEDPLVRFHTKYFLVFKGLCCFIIPFFIPMLFWNEVWTVAFFSQGIRYMLSLHFTWSVNSFAHLWGTKPYDRHIMPVENKAVSIVAMGEGWHNYHHTFPWDYKAAELPYPNNSTTTLIDTFAKLGWAYDLKVATPTLVQAVARNKGDPNGAKMHQL